MAKYVFKLDPFSGRAIVLDTETTGLSFRYGDKIVELAATEVMNGIPTGRTFHRYINPERSVPQEALNVHGLTDSFLRDKPTFREIAPEFIAFVGEHDVPTWAHNSSFDARFVNGELAELGIAPLTSFQCSLKLARATLGKGDRKLSTLADMADVKFDGRGAHSALSDTNVLTQVLVKLLWPKEAEIAGNPDAAPSSSKAMPATKAKSKPKPKARQKAKVEAPKLPENFAPLTSETDPRICRYDDEDIDHLITARGKRWTGEEQTKLVDAFIQEQRPIIELVAEHGRSPAALFLKLEALGVVAKDHPYTRPR